MTAVVVEDGTAKTNADSYCSAAFAALYCAGRGKSDAWDAIEDKDAALRLATDYLTQAYRGRWGGMRFSSTQALDWPRLDVPWDDSPSGVRPYNVIPLELQQATAELALKTADGDLLQDLGRETLSETVDVISVTYAEGRSRQTQYAAVHGMLRSLLNDGGGSFIPMERA